ncbi:unnamed protein product [Soboliphyme baturini]|uniref:Topoisom_I_N domain-containing protein n=1 Tax=Soboliphyme baturini TaxID=241478 RepID=A0A183ICQ3_9BILA|nr:unnamed protein product [Soboliphyme baturini]
MHAVTCISEDQTLKRFDNVQYDELIAPMRGGRMTNGGGGGVAAASYEGWSNADRHGSFPDCSSAETAEQRPAKRPCAAVRSFIFSNMAIKTECDDDENIPLIFRKQQLNNMNSSNDVKSFSAQKYKSEEAMDGYETKNHDHRIAPSYATTCLNDVKASAQKFVPASKNELDIKSEDLQPLSLYCSRMTKAATTESSQLQPKKRRQTISSDDEDEKPLLLRAKKPSVKPERDVKINENRERSKVKKEEKVQQPSKNKSKHKSQTGDVKTENANEPIRKRRKKDEDETEIWKWWEEEPREEGIKWKFLEHKGPLFAPAYDPLPADVRFYYEGKPIRLSSAAEEVATFYGKMLDHEYTTKEVFNNNFFGDWRKVMTHEERELIKDLKRCDFREINAYFKKLSEERKSMGKEEKEVSRRRELLLTIFVLFDVGT